MATVMSVESQRKKIHPHKFTLWVGLGSVIMMFAGLTSAYIVKRDQPNWITFKMPITFWYSTAAILLSSLTIQISQVSFKNREMGKYRRMLTLTAVLGILFIVLQLIGFSQLWKTGVQLRGAGAGQFLYIIFGLHGIHVIGGIVALLSMFIKAFSKHTRNYNHVPIEIVSTYWHFVDILWVYLFVFFLWIQ